MDTTIGLGESSKRRTARSARWRSRRYHYNIQAALTAVTPGQTHIFFPAGTYKVTSTLTLTGNSHLFGVVLIGCGRNTILNWAGTTGTDFFHIDSNP